MTMQQIQYYIKAYETGNLRQAAQELYLTRSALSKAIRELEEEFDLDLFLRTPQGLIPTEAGELLYNRGMELLRRADELSGNLHILSSQTGKTVNLGISPVTGASIFAGVFRPFARENPQITVVPVEGGKRKTQMMLEAGRMDACFTTYSETARDGKGELQINDQLDRLRLYETELVVCVSRDHPLASYSKISVEQLAQTPLVLLKKPLQWESELEYRFSQIGLVPNVFYRAAHLSIVRALINGGQVVSVQMKGSVDDGMQILGIPLDPPALYVNDLVWNKACAQKDGVAQFVEFCRNYNFDKKMW